MKRFLRILRRWTLLAVVLALLITGGMFAYRFFVSAVLSYQYDNSLDATDLAANTPPDRSVTNIALFGVDTREVDVGTRSDCMMVLTIDNMRHKIKLTSLMRDSRVEIEEYGEEKLCHAYAYGGPALAIKTINQTFGTDITEYVTVDFAQMKVLIDLVGGVYLDVNEKERREVNKFIKEYCVERGVPEDEIPYITESGYQHLTGVPAMCYARIRKGGTGDDWGRVERQSAVLNAMFDRVKTLDSKALLNLMQEMSEYVTTSLSPTEIVPLLLGAVKDGMPEIVHSRVPVDGAWKYSSSGQYIEYDLAHASLLLRRFIYEDILPENQSQSADEDAA